MHHLCGTTGINSTDTGLKQICDLSSFRTENCILVLRVTSSYYLLVVLYVCNLDLYMTARYFIFQNPRRMMVFVGCIGLTLYAVILFPWSETRARIAQEAAGTRSQLRCQQYFSLACQTTPLVVSYALIFSTRFSILTFILIHFLQFCTALIIDIESQTLTLTLSHCCHSLLSIWRTVNCELLCLGLAVTFLAVLQYRRFQRLENISYFQVRIK